ncbi:MAG: hypothetical protein Q4P28_02530 [Tissierellia bacterium]|nr:hypothetical protein [Tissierellia bacterium]
MWIIFGICAIIFAILNLLWSFQKKDAKWFRFLSISFTALTVCATYSDEASRVVAGNFSGLMDIMPTMSKILWICVILSILLNSLSLFRK